MGVWILPAFLFYLFGLIFFFFPDFLLEVGGFLNETFGVIMTNRRRKYGWYSMVFFGGLFSLIVGCAITSSYAMEILNISDMKYLPISIKMYSIPFTAVLIITGMVCYYTSYKAMYIVRNLVKMITKDEGKALIAHEKANKIFRIYCVVLILISPILGILSVKSVLGLK